MTDRRAAWTEPQTVSPEELASHAQWHHGQGPISPAPWPAPLAQGLMVGHCLSSSSAHTTLDATEAPAGVCSPFCLDAWLLCPGPRPALCSLAGRAPVRCCVFTAQSYERGCLSHCTLHLLNPERHRTVVGAHLEASPSAKDVRTCVSGCGLPVPVCSLLGLQLFFPKPQA